MPVGDPFDATAPQPPESADDATADVADAPGEPRTTRAHLMIGALLGIGLLAAFVVGGILLASGADHQRADNGPAWSSWKPSQSGKGGAAQIADHVGGRYRESDGSPLVRVRSGPLELAGLPLTVAVRQPAGSVTRFDGTSVLYRLCGLGAGCAISGGKPSVERHLLLRREALELGLYSLRYLDGVDQVVVFMPPRRGGRPGQALFFRKDQVAGELRKPLDATLVDRTPTVARVYKSPDAGLVQRLTLPTLFRFSLAPADGEDPALLLLDPFNSGAPAPAPGTPGLPSTSRS